jgi:hypothetical protein
VAKIFKISVLLIFGFGVFDDPDKGGGCGTEAPAVTVPGTFEAAAASAPIGTVEAAEVTALEIHSWVAVIDVLLANFKSPS